MSEQEKKKKPETIKLKEKAKYKCMKGASLKLFHKGKIETISDEKEVEIALTDLSYESRIELKRAVNSKHVLAN